MTPDSPSKRLFVGALRWNVFASYASQLYSTIVGIAMVPMYLKYMGMEAYGLIGVFAILQLCIQSLDMGITPTLSREAALCKSGATPALTLRRLLRSFETFFIGLGVLIVGGIGLAAGYLATGWLNTSHLDIEEIKRSLLLMAVIAWLRWFAGLYRGIVNGFEKQLWQSGVNIGIATFHSIVVIPYLIYVGSTPTHFFIYQLAISIVDFLLVTRKSYGLLPAVDQVERISFQFTAIRRVFRFSAVLAITAGIWSALAQFDKILLSRILSLSEFGIFSLAIVVAGGVTMLSTPLRIALLPRLTDLSARSENKRFVEVYRSATQFTTVVAFSASLFLALFSSKVLWAWTGNASIATGASQALTLYALGNGVAAFGAFPYYLQYAKGDISLHLVGTILFLAVLIPSVILLTLRFGVVGAGSAWLGSNLAFLICWVPYVHRRFLGKFHWDWIRRDVLTIAGFTSIVGFAASRLVSWPDSRVGTAAVLVLIALLFVCSSGLASPFVRASVIGMISRAQQRRHEARI